MHAHPSARTTILALFASLLALGTCGALAQAPPALGQAAGFAVLGGSAVSNTGATVLTGDLGIWPGLAGSITGFPPGIVVGTTYAGDAVAQQAQSDLTTAFNDLAGRACDTVLTGSDLGGLTLSPGVYCFATEAQLTGTLTLDAQGDANAVFIFQIGTTLTTASNASVMVINGGSACGVFWQVGSSATLGTGSSVAGSVLALASITLTTGASLSGRALASNGAVTLDGNTVSVCQSCALITLSPATLPPATLGIGYSAALVADNAVAPVDFSISAGNLPSGLMLNTNSGQISGIPGAAGSFTFSVTATDANDCTASQSYTLLIGAACPPFELLPATLPEFVAGAAYLQLLQTSAGTAPFSYQVTGGALPVGVVLNPSSGALSGTPTSSGGFSVTITVVDSLGCSSTRSYVGAVAARIVPTTIPALDPLMLLVLAAAFVLLARWGLRR